MFCRLLLAFIKCFMATVIFSGSYLTFTTTLISKGSINEMAKTETFVIIIFMLWLYFDSLIYVVGPILYTKDNYLNMFNMSYTHTPTHNMLLLIRNTLKTGKVMRGINLC